MPPDTVHLLLAEVMKVMAEDRICRFSHVFSVMMGVVVLNGHHVAVYLLLAQPVGDIFI